MPGSRTGADDDQPVDQFEAVALVFGQCEHFVERPCARMLSKQMMGKQMMGKHDPTIPTNPDKRRPDQRVDRQFTR